MHILYLVHISAQLSLFHNKNPTNVHLLSPLYLHFVTPTCLGPQRAIIRAYDWYIFTARTNNFAAGVKSSLLSSVCYVKRQLH